VKLIHTTDACNLITKFAKACDHGAILQTFRLLAAKAPSITGRSVVLALSKGAANATFPRLGLWFRGSELYGIGIPTKDGRDGLGGARMFLNGRSDGYTFRDNQ
jgi:hypothetical protein